MLRASGTSGKLRGDAVDRRERARGHVGGGGAFVIVSGVRRWRAATTRHSLPFGFENTAHNGRQEVELIFPRLHVAR